MYSSEFWNKVYREHQEAPWLTDESAYFFTNEFKRYIDISKTKTVLDYGCGNGKIGMYFMHEGMSVEFADISDEQITKLNTQFEGKVPTYAVSYPKEISNKYDYIICCGVLHHINQEEWGSFLNQFYNLLNPQGRLLISGFDETDSIWQSQDSRAPMTGQRGWYINGLLSIINPNQFKIIDTYKKQIKQKLFKEQRTNLFIILERND